MTAIANLTAAFEHALPRGAQAADSDVPLVIASWPSVPIEIIRAAGLRAGVARGASTPTPAADVHLEADIFPSRLRHLVEAVVTGRLSTVARLVIPRTSDADYKCFLYLRELVRRGVARSSPPTLLFDLLQSSGAAVRDYDVARTRALADALGSVTGRTPSDDDLRHQIARTNAARAAARRLVSLRRVTPRVTGAEAFPLLGAFWQLPPDDYATLAGAAADEIARRRPLAGPRVLLAGAPVDTPALHVAIESRGASVVDEAGPWGNGAAGQDVSCEADPISALSDKYRTDSIGLRTPIAVLQRRTEEALNDVDAVVVSLPPDDTVFGWDYPAFRDRLNARHIPHLCLRGDPYQPVTTEDRARLDTLIAAATRLQETRRG
jgi:benzoyl-CoA reductase/2-hydroxyglutaryl-CoA dehydratase subunit BcrC/BadD/HgdB